MSIRLLIASAAICALGAGGASAEVYKAHHHHHHHLYAARTAHRHLAWRARDNDYAYGYRHYGAAYRAGYAAGYDRARYYGPAPTGTSVNTAYEAPPPPAAGAIYVRGHGYHAWDSPADTSPGADIAVQMRSQVDPTSSVTAQPNPNNVSDQIPSSGQDYNGVPPGGSPYY